MNIFSINGEYDIFLFLLCLIIVQVIGFISVVLSGNIKETYKTLSKPKFFPPTFVFQIVWAILYILMAYSVYRIFIVGTQGTNIKIGLIIFCIQLFLNFICTILFFKLKKRRIAFVEGLILTLSIAVTIICFYNYDKIAAYVLIPCLIWCVFVAVLNYFIYVKNKKSKKVSK